MTPDEEREAVVVNIEALAENLAKQVVELERFVALLRPPDPMNPLGIFPPPVHSRNGQNGKAAHD